MTQSWCLRAGCVLLGIAMLAGAIWLHRRSLHREQALVRMRERERVGQDLHDTLLQGVMSLILRLQIETHQAPELHRARLQRIVDDAVAVWRETRDRVRDLPRQDLGATSMERMLTQFGEQLVLGRGIVFSLQVDGTPQRLREHCRGELTLMAREAIFNAFQHAKASRIDVLVNHGRRAMRVEVRDDGVGMPEGVRSQGGRPDHWGLHGMRGRAKQLGASLEIESAPQRGTRIVFALDARLAYGDTPSCFSLRQMMRRLTVPE